MSQQWQWIPNLVSNQIAEASFDPVQEVPSNNICVMLLSGGITPHPLWINLVDGTSLYNIRRCQVEGRQFKNEDRI
jgi:hypothetical protein